MYFVKSAKIVLHFLYRNSVSRKVIPTSIWCELSYSLSRVAVNGYDTKSEWSFSQKRTKKKNVVNDISFRKDKFFSESVYTWSKIYQIFDIKKKFLEVSNSMKEILISCTDGFCYVKTWHYQDVLKNKLRFWSCFWKKCFSQTESRMRFVMITQILRVLKDVIKMKFCLKLMLISWYERVFDFVPFMDKSWWLDVCVTILMCVSHCLSWVSSVSLPCGHTICVIMIRHRGFQFDLSKWDWYEKSSSVHSVSLSPNPKQIINPICTRVFE